MKNLTAVLLSLLALHAAHAQQHGLINNSKTPHMPLKSVDLDDCRWTDGFWADKQAQCAEVMIPHLGTLMEDPEIIHAYENFLVAAGIKQGEFKGWSFHDGDFYKYIEAMAYAYGMTMDERINKRMDEIIEVIAKAQREDGYLHTMIQIGHGVQGIHHPSEHPFKLKNGPFSVDGQHEFYNFGHLMTAACIHHRITGKTNFLDIAKKASDLKPRFDERLLSGVTVLEGEAEALHNSDSSNQLYQPLSPQKLEKIKITLIPYYAWSNRGIAGMSVWIPLRY